MTDLITRLESAPEGSRELDVRIWAELDDRDVIVSDTKCLGKSRKAPFDACLLGGFLSSRGVFHAGWSKPPYPYFTTSMDDALTLVLDGWSIGQLWEAVDPKDRPWWGVCLRRDAPYKVVKVLGAATIELGTCIACMKARQ